MKSFIIRHKKMLCIWGTLGLGLLAVMVFLRLWTYSTEAQMHWAPEYAKADLSMVLSKEKLEEADYSLLLHQTGLGRAAADKLRRDNDIAEFYRMQEIFFDNPRISCSHNSPISWEERVEEDADNDVFLGQKLLALETGDILITPCSHTYGWRNGHAAIVIDAQKGLTLESVVLGEKSSVQSVKKWEFFPAVAVLRLKGASPERRERIAEEALLTMEHIPYGFSQDIREHFVPPEHIVNTHCSHLVWKLYESFGYDLDSDGGMIVTPYDIAHSELLEIVEIYGINPDALLE